MKILNKLLSLFKNKTNILSNLEIGFDEEKIWLKKNKDKEEKEYIAWENLIGVAIETTDDGPFADDIFFILASKEKTLTFSNSIIGIEEFINRLQELENFSNENFIEAMTCCQNETFVLWDHLGRQK